MAWHGFFLFVFSVFFPQISSSLRSRHRVGRLKIGIKELKFKFKILASNNQKCQTYSVESFLAKLLTNFVVVCVTTLNVLNSRITSDAFDVALRGWLIW